MFPILFEIGPFRLEGYTLFAVLGVVGAILFFRFAAAALKLEPRETAFLAAAGMLGALLGGRLVYVVVNAWYFEHRLSEAFVLWRGGLVSYGGILGLIGAVGIAARVRSLQVWSILDAASIASAIAVGIGRLGCFAAGCDYGVVASTWPWPVHYDDPASAVPTELFGMPLHPVQLYAVAANAAVVGIAYGIFRRSRRPGLTLGAELILYAGARFVLELFRGDDDRGFVWGGLLSTAQFIGVCCFVVGVAVLIRALVHAPEEQIFEFKKEN